MMIFWRPGNCGARNESATLAPECARKRTHLVLGTTESLEDDGLVRVLAADREDDLANVDTSDGAVRLAPRATHTGLQPIRTGARKHFVDPDDVEGVGADTEVERVFARVLHDVFVGANTGGLERLRRELLVLVRDEVSAVQRQNGSVPAPVGNRRRLAGFPPLHLPLPGLPLLTHQKGNSSTPAFLRPYRCRRECQFGRRAPETRDFCEKSKIRLTRSKMRIFGSGTPRLYRLFGYGLFLQYL